MNFVWILFIILAVAHIEAVCVSKYMFYLEEMYCGDCDWWIDGCTKLPFVLTLIPIAGLFTSIVVSVDCVRNIIRALNK